MVAGSCEVINYYATMVAGSCEVINYYATMVARSPSHQLCYNGSNEYGIILIKTSCTRCFVQVARLKFGFYDFVKFKTHSIF